MVTEIDPEFSIRTRLAAILPQLGAQEIAVLSILAKRLLVGQRTYGMLNLARDQRDFEAERADELADVLVYSAMLELQRQLAKEDG